PADVKKVLANGQTDVFRTLSEGNWLAVLGREDVTFGGVNTMDRTVVTQLNELQRRAKAMLVDNLQLFATFEKLREKYWAPLLQKAWGDASKRWAGFFDQKREYCCRNKIAVQQTGYKGLEFRDPVPEDEKYTATAMSLPDEKGAEGLKRLENFVAAITFYVTTPSFLKAERQAKGKIITAKAAAKRAAGPAGKKKAAKAKAAGKKGKSFAFERDVEMADADQVDPDVEKILADVEDVTEDGAALAESFGDEGDADASASSVAAGGENNHEEAPAIAVMGEIAGDDDGEVEKSSSSAADADVVSGEKLLVAHQGDFLSNVTEQKTYCKWTTMREDKWAWDASFQLYGKELLYLKTTLEPLPATQAEQESAAAEDKKKTW
ncbi:unnamed protein product, partial [Amoebophrya sp. A120]